MPENDHHCNCKREGRKERQDRDEGQGQLCHVESGEALGLSPRFLILPLINPHVTLGTTSWEWRPHLACLTKLRVSKEIRGEAALKTTTQDTNVRD